MSLKTWTLADSTETDRLPRSPHPVHAGVLVKDGDLAYALKTLKRLVDTSELRGLMRAGSRINATRAVPFV